MTRYRERREAGEFLPETGPGSDLSGLSKAELEQRAEDAGIDPSGLTKAELRDELEAAGA